MAFPWQPLSETACSMAVRAWPEPVIEMGIGKGHSTYQVIITLCIILNRTWPWMKIISRLKNQLIYRWGMDILKSWNYQIKLNYVYNNILLMSPKPETIYYEIISSHFMAKKRRKIANLNSHFLWYTQTVLNVFATIKHTCLGETSRWHYHILWLAKQRKGAAHWCGAHINLAIKIQNLLIPGRIGWLPARQDGRQSLLCSASYPCRSVQPWRPGPKSSTPRSVFPAVAGRRRQVLRHDRCCERIRPMTAKQKK